MHTINQTSLIEIEILFKGKRENWDYDLKSQINYEWKEN